MVKGSEQRLELTELLGYVKRADGSQFTLDLAACFALDALKGASVWIEIRERCSQRTAATLGEKRQHRRERTSTT
jgi:hypothetical protein